MQTVIFTYNKGNYFKWEIIPHKYKVNFKYGNDSFHFSGSSLLGFAN